MACSLQRNDDEEEQEESQLQLPLIQLVTSSFLGEHDPHFAEEEIGPERCSLCLRSHRQEQEVRVMSRALLNFLISLDPISQALGVP